MKSKTYILTDESLRIAKRLTNHWKHKFEISIEDQIFKIFMPKATIQLEVSPTQLDVIIDNKVELTNQELQQLENVVLDHINRMVQADFKVDWIRSTE